MKVYALIGSSGTGKSYRAMSVAYEKNLDYIIDDGLLIHGNKIVAGRSAKREATAVGAVKRALFSQGDHCLAVREAIEKRKPKGILILGTSDRMVEKIASQLHIGPIQEYVFIEEISTEEERKMAKKQRQEFGKHVIPVPTFEIKEDFSGYFIDPLKIFRKRKDNSMDISEKSVVRPTFSYLGKYTISNKVISDLANHAALKVVGIYKVSKIDIINHGNGIIIKLEIICIYGNSVNNLTKILQKQVKDEVEYMTALNIRSIDVVVKSLKII